MENLIVDPVKTLPDVINFVIHGNQIVKENGTVADVSDEVSSGWFLINTNGF